MTNVVPIRRLTTTDAARLLAARPGDVTGVHGHAGHFVAEVRQVLDADGVEVHIRCSCGRWLGGRGVD